LKAGRLGGLKGKKLRSWEVGKIGHRAEGIAHRATDRVQMKEAGMLGGMALKRQLSAVNYQRSTMNYQL
jgi:hypothetical protein